MRRHTLVWLVLIAVSCNSGKHDASLLQEATGRPGDLVIIMDTTQRAGPLGKTMRDIFMAEVPGLPREEPMFNVTWVHPSRKLHLITQVRNLVYVFTLDQSTPGTRTITDNLSPEILQRIRSDTSFYITRFDDQFSRGQTVIYLFGTTRENLIHHLESSGERIAEMFTVLERNRLVKSILRTTSTRPLTAFLEKEYHCAIHLPIGYKLADKRNDFVWFRQVEADADQSVFISWKPYRSQYQLLPDSLIAWRNAIARRYLFEDPENSASHLTTETEVPFKPVVARQVDFPAGYTMELQGLWKTNNNTMGGPFISCGVVDKEFGRLYYIEGFTFSPGKQQRETIRELEAILWTFRFSR